MPSPTPTHSSDPGNGRRPGAPTLPNLPGPPSAVRRTSYGPTSPEVGARGANTRRRIIDAALSLFDEHGFHHTSVEAIAHAAGVSRATLYQYFPGKDQIFLELMDECALALVRVARRIGELGPTEIGFDNLNWWLGEWSWVFDKYRTMFVQWSLVASSDAAVRPGVIHFVEGYNHRMAARLKAADVSGVDPMSAAVAMTAVVHRLHLFRHTGRVYEAESQELTQSLSVFLQLVLFPNTPSEVLLPFLSPVTPYTPPVPPLPECEGLSLRERVCGLSPRAVTTVGRLVDAAAQQFAAKGCHRTSVDDIVAAAGFARGTFYKYFHEKHDLLRTLCVEATAATVELAGRLRRVDVFDDAALRLWLRDFVRFLDHYRGSLDVWTERLADDDRVIVALGAHAQAVLDRALLDVLTCVRRDYPFDPLAGTLLFRALLTRVPGAMREETDVPMEEEQILDLLVFSIRRGFLSHLVDPLI
ncbi:TetR/AcrR family transcriptional regulator [Streptomyces sp. NPDC058247]|uniref:TetR/AcrR family transcriptional regulator n=1 Tax=Streptomyces sp. NPDC058247 TaxID=3346401 RepID=UPI0036E66726